MQPRDHSRPKGHLWRNECRLGNSREYRVERLVLWPWLLPRMLIAVLVWCCQGAFGTTMAEPSWPRRGYERLRGRDWKTEASETWPCNSRMVESPFPALWAECFQLEFARQK